MSYRYSSLTVYNTFMIFQSYLFSIDTKFFLKFFHPLSKYRLIKRRTPFSKALCLNRSGRRDLFGAHASPLSLSLGAASGVASSSFRPNPLLGFNPPLPIKKTALFGRFFYWSGRRDLNPRHRPWQGRALPLSYTRIFLRVSIYATLFFKKQEKNASLSTFLF